MDAHLGSADLADSEIREIAAWIKHNSVLRGAVTAQQAETINWLALTARSRLWRTGCSSEQRQALPAA